MVKSFDRIRIEVPDLKQAMEEYQRFFGEPPFVCESVSHEPVAWWALSNTVMELVRAPVDRPRIASIVFAAPDAEPGERQVENTLGLAISLGDGRSTEEYRLRQAEVLRTGFSVDHIVLHADDAEACIALFSGQLGLRLALDKTVPEWGGRMLFFRAGQLTLEVIASEAERPDGNTFWGLAYQCQDLAELVRDLASRQVAVSEIREGRKPGTQVATLRSHCLDIPTLLIQPVT